MRRADLYYWLIEFPLTFVLVGLVVMMEKVGQLWARLSPMKPLKRLWCGRHGHHYRYIGNAGERDWSLSISRCRDCGAYWENSGDSSSFTYPESNIDLQFHDLWCRFYILREQVHQQRDEIQAIRKAQR